MPKLLVLEMHAPDPADRHHFYRCRMLDLMPSVAQLHKDLVIFREDELIPYPVAPME